MGGGKVLTLENGKKTDIFGKLDDILDALLSIDNKLQEQNEYWIYWKKLKDRKKT